MIRTQLHVEDILRWADAFHRRKKRWPSASDGRVSDAPGEKWANIDQALRKGLRGLPGKWSLAQLLADHRGHRNRKRLPKYTISTILRWADHHFETKHRWPINSSGKIHSDPGETWFAVDMALRKGRRGFPGGSSLAELLEKHRRVPNRLHVSRLSTTKILAWADRHRKESGNWPNATSGIVSASPNDTWTAIDLALKGGGRGLRGRTSLAKLLARHRGVKRHVRKPPLAIEQILSWADAYHARTGKWPKTNSGPIAGSVGVDGG